MESKYTFYMFSVKITCLFHFVTIDLFFGFITQPGSNSYRSSSFCCYYIEFRKTALSPIPPLLMDVKVMPQFSLLNIAQEQRALSEISVHSSGRCWNADLLVWACFILKEAGVGCFWSWRLPGSEFRKHRNCLSPVDEGYSRGKILNVQIFTQCLVLTVCSAGISRGPLVFQGPCRHWGLGESQHGVPGLEKQKKLFCIWKSGLHKCGFLGLSLRMIFSICISFLGVP